MNSLLSCVAAGAALALCLPKPGLGFLAYGVPAVLLDRAARASSPGRAAALGLAFGAAFCGTTLNWVYFTCRFAGVAAPVSGLAWAALAAFLALPWAAFGWAVRLFSRRLPRAVAPLAWAAAWAALESAGSHWTPRFAVDLLSYTQWRHLAMIQVGALFGPHALSWLLMLWNGALAGAIRAWREGGPGAVLRDRGLRWNAGLAVVLLAACAAYGTGVLRGRADPGAAPGGGLRVEILQPDIDQYQKWDSGSAAGIRAVFDGLLAGARAGRPDLVVWPESGLPGWFDDPENGEWAAGIARKLQAPMIVGSVTRAGTGMRNSAVHLGASGSVEGLYHKRVLVPFGEFVPWRRWLEPWVGILSQMGDMEPGSRGQALFRTAAGPTAASICYEAAFPHLLRADAGRGARVFVNLTNDGWYKDTWAPYQHFTVNVFRAVENRVTLVRAANTGISGVIDPYGVVLARTELRTRARLDVRVSPAPAFPDGSWYSRNGDWFGYGAMAVSALLLGWAFRRGTRPERG